MLTSFFNDINPENPLEGIVGNAFGILTGNMSGSSGGIGGFIKGIFWYVIEKVLKYYEN